MKPISPASPRHLSSCPNTEKCSRSSSGPITDFICCWSSPHINKPTRNRTHVLGTRSKVICKLPFNPSITRHTTYDVWVYIVPPSIGNAENEHRWRVIFALRRDELEMSPGKLFAVHRSFSIIIFSFLPHLFIHNAKSSAHYYYYYL